MSNDINNEINNMMEERQNEFNQATQNTLIGNQNNNDDNINEIRNDNDFSMIEREQNLKEEDMMNKFDEQYYLEETDDNELLKKKALDLETLIVERLARDKKDDANKIFGVLKILYNKYNNDFVKDIYFRVLLNMPKSKKTDMSKYSYEKDKNSFSEILDNLKEKGNIKAFNEESPCISQLGSMWEVCDLDICSEKCSKEILKTKKTVEDNEECKNLVTGYDEEEKKSISMDDDVKDIILERLRYCKKLADEKRKSNVDLQELTYQDMSNLKTSLIKSIYKMSDLANLHYSSCLSNASEFFLKNDKYSQILKLLKEMDYKALSVERLQDIRNSLTMLPTCDMLRYTEHEKNRDDNVKGGIRVGKYIIPKNTDFYNQIEGKDKPNIYRDLVSNKTYLYDPFSKTLTGMKYPMTQQPNIENSNINSNNVSPSPSLEMNENNLLAKEIRNEIDSLEINNNNRNKNNRNNNNINNNNNRNKNNR
mgnify:CR=1 FL=1